LDGGDNGGVDLDVTPLISCDDSLSAREIVDDSGVGVIDGQICPSDVYTIEEASSDTLAKQNRIGEVMIECGSRQDFIADERQEPMVELEQLMENERSELGLLANSNNHIYDSAKIVDSQDCAVIEGNESRLTNHSVTDLNVAARIEFVNNLSGITEESGSMDVDNISSETMMNESGGAEDDGSRASGTDGDIVANCGDGAVVNSESGEQFVPISDALIGSIVNVNDEDTMDIKVSSVDDDVGQAESIKKNAASIRMDVVADTVADLDMYTSMEVDSGGVQIVEQVLGGGVKLKGSEVLEKQSAGSTLDVLPENNASVQISDVVSVDNVALPLRIIDQPFVSNGVSVSSTSDIEGHSTKAMNILESVRLLPATKDSVPPALNSTFTKAVGQDDLNGSKHESSNESTKKKKSNPLIRPATDGGSVKKVDNSRASMALRSRDNSKKAIPSSTDASRLRVDPLTTSTGKMELSEVNRGKDGAASGISKQLFPPSQRHNASITGESSGKDVRKMRPTAASGTGMHTAPNTGRTLGGLGLNSSLKVRLSDIHSLLVVGVFLLAFV